MLWTEVRKWAKENGYDCSRTKIEDKENSYIYYWKNINDANNSGTSTSVSKLATDIYNMLTDGQWIEYQKEYKEKQEYKHFSI